MPDPTAPFDVPTVLASMTLAEKVAVCSGRDAWTVYGVERLGVPSIRVADGPHGLRKTRRDDDVRLDDNVPATCFPTASALAATWDPSLVEEVARAIGREARAEGISVVLGPGANIKRTPVCGRNFEYFSEDPHLSSALAAAWIRGVQGVGVGASLKHFAANNQEHRRFTIDTLVDERTLREIYLASFEGALAAGPWTVMAAYNRLDGVHCTEHEGLLTTILRDEWGFDGVVVSDWGGVHDRVASAAAGLDLEMPGYRGRSDPPLLAACAEDRLPVEAIDRAAGRVLTLLARAARPPGEPADLEAHHALARRVAADAAVLLKNDGVLPLAPGARVAVIGAFAKEPRYQGAGSSVINPHRIDDAWTAIAALAPGASYAPGYPRRSGAVDEALIAEAREIARGADVALVFAGLTEASETEGLDRDHLRLPEGHDALVAAIALVHPRVVVVLGNGAPVQMPWRDHVAAIVEGHLGGQAGGSGIADVLFGAEPGGRLAETFPLRWEGHPVQAMPTGPRQVEYREGLFVGYRYYDAAKEPVLFPFGHGLSYTTFAWSDVAAPSTARAGEAFEVAVTVTNTGPRAGAEVVQVYVHGTAADRPEQALRGFAKVRLGPGESRRVPVALDRRAFSVWDVRRHAWVVAAGRYEIRVGASSRDVRATATVDVLGEVVPDGPPPDLAGRFGREAFAALYGRPLPDNAVDEKGRYTLDTPIGDMRSVAARLLVAAMRWRARSLFGTDEHDPTVRLVHRMFVEMPLRTLVLITDGGASHKLLAALLEVVNGRLVRGLWTLLSRRGGRQLLGGGPASRG